MFRRTKVGIALMLSVAALTMGSCRGAQQPAAAKSEPGKAVAFKAARLIVEINDTDGDAGLQLFLDHEPWSSVALFHQDGTKIMDVTNQGVLKDYGLTELFSESSEPPFETFPLSKFKELFPAGSYRLTGTTIEGERIESTVTLSHAFPDGPKITSPAEDSRVPVNGLVVKWDAVADPAGSKIAGYQVLVVREKPTVRTFSADLSASARQLTIPIEFLEPKTEYKIEVLAVAENGNQTLSEIAFKTS